jgi:hypothetical protein
VCAFSFSLPEGKGCDLGKKETLRVDKNHGLKTLLLDEHLALKLLPLVGGDEGLSGCAGRVALRLAAECIGTKD